MSAEVTVYTKNCGCAKNVLCTRRMIDCFALEERYSTSDLQKKSCQTIFAILLIFKTRWELGNMFVVIKNCIPI